MPYNIKMDIEGMERESVVWIHVAENRDQFQAYVKMVTIICVS
jgi:hypothetical protein